MSGYTKGLWVAGRSDMGTIVDGISSKWIYAGEQYVAVASGRIEGEWSEVMANAHLIAAAPDLYEALKACLNRLDTRYEDDFSDEVDAARAAIAKAEGSTQ